jgi:hypothetical protein
MAIANKSLFCLVTMIATNIGANTISITYEITLMLKLWLYMEAFKFSLQSMWMEKLVLWCKFNKQYAITQMNVRQWSGWCTNLIGCNQAWHFCTNRKFETYCSMHSSIGSLTHKIEIPLKSTFIHLKNISLYQNVKPHLLLPNKAPNVSKWLHTNILHRCVFLCVWLCYVP